MGVKGPRSVGAAGFSLRARGLKPTALTECLRSHCGTGNRRSTGALPGALRATRHLAIPQHCLLRSQRDLHQLGLLVGSLLLFLLLDLHSSFPLSMNFLAHQEQEGQPPLLQPAEEVCSVKMGRDADCSLLINASSLTTLPSCTAASDSIRSSYFSPPSQYSQSP